MIHICRRCNDEETIVGCRCATIEAPPYPVPSVKPATLFYAEHKEKNRDLDQPKA